MPASPSLAISTRIEVNGDEFFLDLLFYHTRLHCYDVVDLKVVDFQPEFAGKMSFYQAAVDRQVKTPEDGATIGIILCRGKNQTVVEYHLARRQKSDRRRRIPAIAAEIKG